MLLAPDLRELVIPSSSLNDGILRPQLLSRKENAKKVAIARLDFKYIFNYLPQYVSLVDDKTQTNYTLKAFTLDKLLH